MNATNNDTLNNTVCYVVDPSAPQAKRGFDVWLYIAYACIMFSYVNINILVFRFWLILSAIFFVIWSCDPVRAVQIDALLFNSSHIIINLIQCIPLVKQVWPVKLTELEEEIYNRDFASNMNKKQFKRMIRLFKVKTYDADDSQLCCIRSNFEYVIYVAKINPGWSVRLTKDSTETLTELKEGSWIGTIEYMLEQERKQGSRMTRWGITATVRPKGFDNPLQTDQERNIEDAGCIIYYFDIEVSV